MSTKKLERTVIEGGRYGRNKWERRESHKTLRAAEKNYLTDVLKDPENFEEKIIEKIQPVYQGFTDKLRPMYRWLASQVGRKWSEVHKEVFEKFDTKTTAGRHITFDHLLSSVVDTLSGWDDRGRIAANQKSYSDRYSEYYVDPDGILCKCASREHTNYTYLKPEQYQVICDWLAGRMIGEHGGVLYWFSPVEGIWKCEWSKVTEVTKYGNQESLLGLRYFNEVKSPYLEMFKDSWGYTYSVNRTGLHWEVIKNPAGFKQRAPLTQDEAKHFRLLDKKTQQQILNYTKGRF